MLTWLRVAILWLIFVSSVQGQGFQAGAARGDITPPTGFAMWGYGVRKDLPSEGVAEPLQARCLVLAVGERRLALFSLDLGRAPTRDSTARIREQLKQLGISEVFLVASHTHHGPVLEVDDWPTKETSYVRSLEKKLVALATEAVRILAPAKLGLAHKAVPFNRNRHSRLPDKPVDQELLLLRVESERGQLIAHAVNFAAHATLLDVKERKFAPDWPGTLAVAVEKATGAPCLYLQGAAGDLSPNAERGQSSAQFGEKFAKEVLALSKTIVCQAPAKPALVAQHETLAFRSRVDLGNPIVKAIYVQAFFKELVAFYEREYREGIRPELTLATLNENIGFVGVSGELFTSHALHLKKRARLEHLFVLGYCNDYQQYFPTIEACAEGGYGADPAVAPAQVGAGEALMDRALLRLYQMRGKLREPAGSGS